MAGAQVPSMRLPGQLLAKLLAQPVLPHPDPRVELGLGKRDAALLLQWQIFFQIPCDRRGNCATMRQLPTYCLAVLSLYFMGPADHRG